MLKTDGENENHMHYHGVDQVERHVSVRQALSKFLSQIKPVGAESIFVSEAPERILAEDVYSRINVPSVARSTRDGYAIRISGQSAEMGTKFVVLGDVKIGTAPSFSLQSGQAVKVATGSNIPRSSNAVVMKEYVQETEKSITISKSANIGENVLREGEDIGKNTKVLEKDTFVGPQHIALLAHIGMKKIRVFRRPKVSFFSTGDELIDVERPKKGSKIYDINRPFISSAVIELGAKPLDLGIARDDLSVIRKKIVQGLKADALILSAGSSVGDRDYAKRAVDSLPEIRTLVHGVAMRPSSPTGLAIFKGKPLIMLPGFPTSAIVSFFVFARPAILKLSGRQSLGLLTVKARLIEGYDGRKGVTHFPRVLVKKRNGDYVASVVGPSDAYYSSWLKNANGIAVIGEDRVPVNPNDQVEVFMIGDIDSGLLEY
jgi:molybdenum cofactor synthesis domain-containing protein